MHNLVSNSCFCKGSLQLKRNKVFWPAIFATIIHSRNPTFVFLSSLREIGDLCSITRCLYVLSWTHPQLLQCHRPPQSWLDRTRTSLVRSPTRCLVTVSLAQFKPSQMLGLKYFEFSSVNVWFLSPVLFFHMTVLLILILARVTIWDGSIFLKEIVFFFFFYTWKGICIWKVSAAEKTAYKVYKEK